MALPQTWVEAPARTPRPNRSLDVIPVHETSDRFVGIQFLADPCVMPGSLPQDCVISIGPALGTEKEFGEPGAVYESDVFGVYAGVECFLNGGITEFRETARRILTNGEHYAVDGVLAGILRDLSAPTAPTTGATMAAVIGALETALAQNVPGQGYIFLSPAQATQAAAESLLVRNIDGTLETFLGTPVVVLTAATGTNAYASGPVNIWRTPINVIDAPNVTVNLGRAIAERLYTLTIECGVWRTIYSPAAPPQSPPGEGPGTPLSLVIGSIPSSPIPDGTDTTIHVHANVAPADEVYLWYSVNGGPAVQAGEMTEVTPTTFVWNVQGGSTTTGDTVEVWAVSGTTESNHIIIEVT